MKWKTDTTELDDGAWVVEKKFAFLPKRIDDTIVWLEYYWIGKVLSKWKKENGGTQCWWKQVAEGLDKDAVEKECREEHEKMRAFIQFKKQLTLRVRPPAPPPPDTDCGVAVDI